MNLGEGAMLFQIPKSTGGAKITTGAIAASSKGATGIIERHAHFYVKVLVLEGSVRCYLTSRVGESLVCAARPNSHYKARRDRPPGPGAF